ncbi:MAG: EamA family transporter [Bryobacteraceae bacterium]
MSERQYPTAAWAALASVCFFWGTTYLAIRVALESFPPLLLVASRFWASGILMFLLVRWRGYALPAWRDSWLPALTGFLILGAGNGCLVFSERIIPSSLAALFITVSPFWMTGMESLIPGGVKLDVRTLGGMLLGLSGPALLFVPNIVERGFSGNIWQGFLILQLGCASWSLGSILQKRRSSTVHPFANAAVQQLAAGVAFTIPALVAGGSVHWTPSSATAWVYLVTFGSIVGFSSYVYALEKLPVAIVSIYSYVNPIVAAVLGWIAYREPFGWRETAAMALTFAGVAVVKRVSR